MNLRRLQSVALSAIFTLSITARHRILTPDIKTLQVVVNQEWTSPPVMQLHSEDVLHVGFDQMAKGYHRYVAHLEHCSPDFTPTDGLFESDWLEGFNDLPIDDYELSLNTTVGYTHYTYQLPNDQQRLRLSGNYRLHIVDDETGDDVAVAEFRVAEPLMTIGMSVTANTDIAHNRRYQQVEMSLNYADQRITNVAEQIQTYVVQNQQTEDQRHNPKADFINTQGQRWEHCRDLVFEGGNEYHKFEVLDVSHATMGLDNIVWDDEQRSFHAFPFVCEPRRNYVYDEDADGAFYIRNSDNMENDRMSDYVLVHYKLAPADFYDNARLVVDGQWTTEDMGNYVMVFDPADRSYNAVVLQKQGYYNYRFLMLDAAGQPHVVPEEGSFYQTENRYQAYVYYRPSGGRYWQLAAYREIVFSNH